MIALLVIVFIALAAYGGFVLHQVSDTAKRFDARSCEIFEAEKLLFTEQRAALKETTSICMFQMIKATNELRDAHANALQGMAATHASAMQEVNDSHGKAAKLLESAVGAHHAAAGASAEACTQLRAAADQINSVVSNSDVFAIRQHLLALRKFFIGKNEI